MDRLVVDDIRTLNFEATYARNIIDAKYYLKNASWDQVWLDHDMGENNEGDVSELVKWMEEAYYTEQFLPVVDKFLIHTSNPVRRQEMADVLRDLGFTVVFVTAENYFHMEEKESE